MARGQARRDQPSGGRTRADQRDIRDTILNATAQLLSERDFDALSIADILHRAAVSRSSFYFYFDGKHAVLAELVRRAVAGARTVAQPWVEEESAPPELALRHGTGEGARLWREQAPVLRAIVEQWRSDPRLTALWLEMMEGFTAAATFRIERDRATGRAPDTGVGAHTLASALTWLSERAYYLAAVGHPAFNDEPRLIDVLTSIWLAAIYNGPPSRRCPDATRECTSPELCQSQGCRREMS